MNRHSNTTYILLVEDSDDDAFFFEHALAGTRLDCTVLRIPDGTKALAHMASIKAGAPVPDLIFLDLKLPGHSGFEILEWIRGQEFPPLRITVLSGSDHQADIVRARELGVTDYVVKPISTDDFKKRIMALSGDAEPGPAQHKSSP